MTANTFKIMPESAGEKKPKYKIFERKRSKILPLKPNMTHSRLCSK